MSFKFWWKYVLLTLVIVSLPALSFALPEIDASFTEMVVQRGAAFRIWGKETSADRVSLFFNGQQYESTVVSGVWSASLNIPENLTGNQEITVRSTSGHSSKNILVGDVWVCSGQSNMALKLRRAADGKSIISSAIGKPIRLLKIETGIDKGRSDSQPERWLTPIEPATLEFSAVCLAFGSSLAEKQRIPIGLIDISLGSTSIETWISSDGMSGLPEIKTELGKFERHSRALMERRGEILLPEVGKASGLFNKFIRPRTNTPIKGVVWYQGESNLYSEQYYESLLSALIFDWRDHFGNDSTNFVIIQLPGFGKITDFFDNSSWAIIRDEQLIAAKTAPCTALAVTIDLGDGTIHPLEKRRFGQRAADAALTLISDCKLKRDTSSFVSSYSFGRNVKINLGCQGKCLSTVGDISKAFYIAGNDRCWFPAEGYVDGNSIILGSKKVPYPVAVRYAWSDRPIPVLFTSGGTPVSPFRSDDWPIARRGEIGNCVRDQQ